MGFIASIIVGVIAGWATGRIMGGSGYGFWADLVLGLIGAAVGGWLGGILFGVDLTTGVNLTTIITAIVGSVIVVAIYRMVTRRRV